MKVPIPDDWNGEDWLCIQLEWPQSDQWIGLLTGILTLLTRGRYWDEKTGQITDVQEIAWTIFNRSYPFVDCDGGEISETPDQDLIHCLISSAMGPSDEELVMGLCGYNPKAFRINNGVFQVRDFCGEWEDIGIMSSTKEEPPPDIWGDIDPEPDFYSCGKVEYIIDQFILLSDAAWDNWTNPFVIELAMRNAVTDAVNLERAHVYEWMGLLLAVSQVASKSDFNDAAAVQNAKCAAVGSVAATGVGTDAEVDAVVASLAAAFNAEIGEISEIPWAAYWGFVRDTFGRKDCRLLLSLGATDPSADCSCFEADPYTGVVTFEDDRVIILESQGATLSAATLMTPHIMRLEMQGAQNENFQEVHWDEKLVATGTIQELQIEFPIVEVDIAGFYPAEGWSEDNPTTIGNYMKPPASNSPDDVDYYPVPGKQVVICKWAAPVDLNNGHIDFGVKINPRIQSTNQQRYLFDARIVYAGDLR